MMKDTPSIAVLAVEHADAPNQEDNFFLGISTCSIPFLRESESLICPSFLENSHMPLQNFPFSRRNGTKKKGPKFSSGKFSWKNLSRHRCGRAPLPLTSQVAKSSPKVAAHPPRPAAESGSRWIPKTIEFVVENSTESHEGLPFFFQIYMLLNVLEQFFQHFVKSPETQHFHLYTTFVTL